MKVLMKTKVYCNNCRWFLSISYHLDQGYSPHEYVHCRHANNLKVQHTYRRQLQVYKREPEKINSKNDCRWFELRIHWYNGIVQLFSKLKTGIANADCI